MSEDYLRNSDSENYLTPPRQDVHISDIPYSNSSNHILRQLLEARDEVRTIQAELVQLQIDINSGAVGLDIAALAPRPVES